MPTKNPRLNLVLDAQIYAQIHKLSRREGISMSLIARDLLKEALILQEDVFWAKQAEEREKTLKNTKVLSHKDVWK